MSGILSTQCPYFLREQMAAGSTAARRARRFSQRESSLGVAWGARRKPGIASPANMSKRGLSARHSVPNQTLSLVKFWLPKGNLAAGNPGRPGVYGPAGHGFRGTVRAGIWAWPPVGLGRMCSSTYRCHPPRRRRIQYAAASRINHWRLGLLDPRVRGDDD